MRFYNFLLIISFVTAGISSGQNTRLTIYSSPDDVQIRLDSVIVGTTPLTNYEILPGTHRVEAISPYEGIWNIGNLVESFTIKSGHDTTLRIQFQKIVKIKSVPYHAKLLYNNDLMGLTPLTIPYEENRGKKFSLEKKGYKTKTFMLNEPHSQFFTLEPINLKSQDKDEKSFTHALLHSRLKTKFLFLSGAVAAHWLAFYFKNIADDNYIKYTRTSNPQLMEKYWDKTQKYDRFSEISLGISYAFLSGLIYTVLWH